MTTIIFVFFVAFLASLLLTPLAIRVARRYNIVDIPAERKVHDRPVPRLGGAALYFSFVLAVWVLYLNRYMYTGLVSVDHRIPLVFVGLTVAFLLGLWDDISNLSAGIKFLGQIVIAVFSYYAGIKITVISMPLVGYIDLGYFALPFTVFWFVLAINAINLIDGLDGLAAGICLFVSITMMVICLISGRVLEAITFAALAGALIGFLRYNFNPAKIFMGDSGSYFLGYLIAAMSILGSIKGQVATAILIPIIALGIPMIDTLFAPIRRFVKGRGMFQPDKKHFHHRLIEMGYSQRRAVLIIYGLTILLGITAIVMIHAKDETAALILMVLGIGVIFLGRYCGLMDLFVSTRIGRWFRDIPLDNGYIDKRHDFLNHQTAIASAENVNEFWKAVCETIRLLEFDFAELNVYNPSGLGMMVPGTDMKLEHNSDGEITKNNPNRPAGKYSWFRENSFEGDPRSDVRMLKIDQPLYGSDETTICYGNLFLAKNMIGHQIDSHTLKRAELMRLVMSEKLDELHRASGN